MHRPDLRKNYLEIFVNTDRTLIHITNGGNRPPENSLMKENGTPVFKTDIIGAFLIMFRHPHRHSVSFPYTFNG
jgi:hypothetical protein